MVIAWRTTSLDLRVLQAQRLACDYCGDPYFRLAVEAISPSVFSGVFDEKQAAAERLIGKARSEVAKLGPLQKRVAPCPACQQHPPTSTTPTSADRRKRVAQEATGAAMIGAVLGLVVGIWVPDVAGMAPAALGLLMGGVLGATLGSIEPLYTGPPWRPHHDPRSKTWWYRDLRAQPEARALLVSLPTYDWTQG